MKTARRAFLPGCGPLWFGLELDAWDQAPCCLVLPEPSAPDGGFRSRLCGFAGAELSMGKRVLPGREPEPALLCVRALDWDGALTVPDTGLPNGFDIRGLLRGVGLLQPGDVNQVSVVDASRASLWGECSPRDLVDDRQRRVDPVLLGECLAGDHPDALQRVPEIVIGPVSLAVAPDSHAHLPSQSREIVSRASTPIHLHGRYPTAVIWPFGIEPRFDAQTSRRFGLYPHSHRDILVTEAHGAHS